VRCVGCETEPSTSTQYCESCGIRVWQETQGFETPPVTGVDHWASDSNPASDSRCESCGGPGANGDLCGACQRAFFGSWLDSEGRAAQVSDPATAVADAALIAEKPYPDVSAVAPARDPSDTATMHAAAASPVLAETTMTSLDDTMAGGGADVITVDEARATTVRRQEARARAAFATQSTELMTAATHARAAEPAVVNKRQDAAVPSQQRYHTIALVATGLVVAAIGATAYWLQFHQEPVVPREDTQAPVAKSVLVARRRTSASGLPAAALTGRKPAALPPEVSVSPRPKPAASAPAPARAVRSPSVPIRQVASVSVPNPTTEARAPPVVEPFSPAVVATALPSPPSAPVGRFFETADVNESPRIATRVEPQLPDECRPPSRLRVPGLGGRV